MEILLHQTTKIVKLNGIEARVWEGTTLNGIPVVAYITRLQADKLQDQTQFLEELKVASAPSRETEAIPLRMLI